MLVVSIITGLAAVSIAANLTDENEVGPFGIFLKWQMAASRLQSVKGNLVLLNIGHAMGCVFCMTFWMSVGLFAVWYFSPLVWSFVAIPFAAYKIGLFVHFAFIKIASG